MFTGRNQGLNFGVATACRVVGGSLRYIPAHIKNGKSQPQKLMFSVGINRKFGKNAERTDYFPCNVWGGYADLGCKVLAPGKAIDIHYTPETYVGTLFNQDGTARIDNAGQAIQVPKFSLRIEDFILGEGSEKTILNEISEGKRGQYWNVSGHADNVAFIARSQQKMAITFDPASATFGYATVRLPANAQVDMAAYQKSASVPQAAPMTAAVAQAADAPVVNQQFTPGVVTTPAPAAQPVETPAAASVQAPGAVGVSLF